jgi:acyl CoA:acetate/3-ketoacid CoA transferase alpha subunit
MSETLNVNKDTTLDADLIVTKAATAWTHSGGTSLTVTSTNGYIKLVSTSQYVDVESVRFTDDYIGVAGDTDIIRLTSTGSVATVLLDGKLDVTDDVRIGDTSDPKLTVDASNGNTVINGTLDVNGDAVFEGQVLVKGFFHALGDYRIGDSAPSDSLTIKAATNQTGDMTMMDTLDVYGVTTLYNNLVIVGSKDLTMNTDKFKVTGSSGNVETLGSVTMHAVSSVLTHDGAAGSLAISSSTGPVTIEGQTTGGYVDVESIRFTDNQIGSTGDPDLITIVDDAVTIAGGLTTTTMAVTSTFGVTSDFTVNTDQFIVHSSNGNVTMKGDLEMEGDTATLSHSGSTGGLAISSAQHVDVESVRFTGDQIGSTGDPDLITLTADNVKVAGTLEMSVNSAALTHSGTTSLAISSTNGHITIAGGSGATDYVDVESVRFTDNKIGSTGDANLITLVNDKMSLDGALDLTNEDATITHTASTSTPTLTISSTNGPVSVVSDAQYVDVESVRFTGDQIGLDGDTAIMQLTTANSVGNVAVDGTVTMIDDATSLTHTGATSLTISSSQAAAFVKIQGGSAAYVQVESVKITDNQIGTVSDANLITLEDDKMSLDGALDLTDEDATITHTASSGTPTLTISSTNGPVSVVSTAQYVDVESVRFTGDQIGLDGDTAIMQLTTAASVGNVAIDGTVTMIDDATSFTHTGTTSFAISSTNGVVTIAGGSGASDYVDVEDVRFTGDKIGLNGDTAILQLTTVASVGKVSIDGTVEMIDDATSLTHTGTTSLAISSTNGHITIAGGADDYVDVESIRFTDNQIGLTTDTDLITLSDGNVEVTGTMNVTDDVTLTKDAVALTHSGTTSLAISSTNGHITIAGGSGATDYVDVESVRFTDNKIGSTGDANLITLVNDKMSLDGALDLTNEDATITHTASTGTPTLTISSTNGPVSVVSTAQYVDVESVRFTGDQIGLDGDTAIMQLTTANSVGNVAVDGTVTMIDDATSLTHTGATSLTISSSQAAAFVKIQGGSAAYVQVESVKITDNQIGTVSDANLITLEDDKMSLDGALDLTDEDATITHTASSGTPTLTISSTNGPVSVVSTAQYVDVESVRFTGDQIGLDGDTAIMQLTTAASVGNVAIDGTVTMIDDATSFTHTGTTSLGDIEYERPHHHRGRVG